MWWKPQGNSRRLVLAKCVNYTENSKHWTPHPIVRIKRREEPRNMVETSLDVSLFTCQDMKMRAFLRTCLCRQVPSK